ncbi:hypothetical protein Tco_0759679, partial [Tanacetum coccineum]
PKLGLWYPRDSPFDLEAFSDSDYAGDSLDKKSTTGGCQFLGKRLISWQCKTQTIVANSTTEAEYVAAANYCGQKLIQVIKIYTDHNVADLLRKAFDVSRSGKTEWKRAATTASSLEAEQDSEAQTRFEAASKQSNDPPLSRVNTLGSEDSMKLKELMELCTKLSEKILDNEKQKECIVDAVRLNLLLHVLVYAARHILTAVRHKLMLPGFNHSFDQFYTLIYSLIINPNSNSSLIIKPITMSTPKFADTHNLYAFLEKPEESNGFEEIIDFLNTSLVQYALTVNPTIYTTCIEQFWTSAKVKTINGERQIQALVAKKKVIITKTSIRSDLKLDDAEGTDFLPTATIFAELERMGYENLTQKLTFYKAYFSSQWKFIIHTILQCLSAKTTSWNEFSSTMASAIICLATNKNFNFSKYIFDNMLKNLEGGVKFHMCPRFVQVFMDKQVEGMSRHKGIYVIHSHTKKVFANMKRPGKGVSGKVIPLFATMMVQATKDMGEDLATRTDSHSTPIHT